ncbi:molybdate ABC transporter, ATP-binding protein, partial [Vibrio parahaemolyticus V-223/04]
FPLSM